MTGPLRARRWPLWSYGVLSLVLIAVGATTILLYPSLGLLDHAAPVVMGILIALGGLRQYLRERR